MNVCQQFQREVKDAPHGTITGYATYRCRCLPCTDAWRDYAREYARESRAGGRRTVKATATLKHLEVLLGYGLTQHAIADAAGLSQQCIANIVSGRNKRVTLRTEDAVLGVTMDEFVTGHNVPATKVQALVKAMERAGFTRAEIDRMLGRQLQLGNRSHVYYRTFERVRTLYRLLAHKGLVPAYVLEEV